MNALASFSTISTILSLAWGLFINTGCSSTPKIDDSRPAEQLAAHALTQIMAQHRSAQLSHVKYDLFIDVSVGAKSFNGEQRIRFDLKPDKKIGDVWLDYQGGTITFAEINGAVTKLERGPVHVRLPKDKLVSGTNLVVIKFEHEYSRTGSGLHRFQDPEDKKVYLYTQFEPFAASRWAPFFDQPDIKAPLTLKIKAPSDWKVIANTPENKYEAKYEETMAQKKTRKKIKATTWAFAPTAPISTYLYAMVAGPFVVWQDQYKEVPLRLFARKSLARYVHHQEWFDITKQGFDFFEKYFDVSYPFGKYDQLIVPEFNAGAMENVGAVTFSEKFIQRGEYTRRDRSRIASVVLHEMAHMWFGNLVTMKWWDDLWLNESFATYMSSLALVKATDFKEAWTNFRVYKNDAYNIDQSIVTHPIAGAVANTDEAFNNFDAITYGKGASVMKELRRHVGGDVFRASLREYFKKHSYKNAVFSDFAAAFESASKLNLKNWFHSWFETSGVDTVTQAFQCTPLKVDYRDMTKLSFKLSLSNEARPHSIQLVAYRKNRENQLVRVVESSVQTDIGQGDVSREVLFEGSDNCPDFIYANFEDQGYFKVTLDQVSLQFILNNIDLIKSSELRVSLWSDLWQMVRDQKLKVAQFSDIALKSLAREQDIEVLSFLISKGVGSDTNGFDTVYYYWPQTFEQERVVLKQVTDAYEDVLYARMIEAKEKANRARYKTLKNPYADQYKLFFVSYLASVNSSRGVANAVEMLSKTKDPDLRWKILYTLSRANYSSIDQLIAQELRVDKSDSAKKNALSCRVVRPDPVQKEKYLKTLTTDLNLKYSADELNRVSLNMFPARQRDTLGHYRSHINNGILQVWPQLDSNAQSTLAENLAPADCTSAVNLELQKIVQKNVNGSNKLPTNMLKPLMSEFDSDRLCVAIRKYNQE